MRKIRLSIIVVITVFLVCCREWDDHYVINEPTVNSLVWDSISNMDRYSEFVKYIEAYGLDSIIMESSPKTIFVTDNEAMELFLERDTFGFNKLLRYHIAPSVLMLTNISDNKQIYTMSEKFALIEKINDEYFLDGVRVLNSSPVFKDGRYFEIEEFGVPKPSLYEFIKANYPLIADYIDAQDSIILDKEKSKEVGYNEFGETVYDSVLIRINKFEDEYFEISKEFRDIRVSMILPDRADYEDALNDMCSYLDEYDTYLDIPVSWQNNQLFPKILFKGIYSGLVEPDDFLVDRKVNIKGDSIDVDFTIDPLSKINCSNGIIFNYSSFNIDGSLFQNRRLEAEDVIEKLGSNDFAWDETLVQFEGEKSFKPTKQEVLSASNDSAASVTFSSGFTGDYSITFTIQDVFAGDYRLVWRTNQRKTGEYSIYVNDQKLGIGIEAAESFDVAKIVTGFFSVLGYKLYPDKLGYCDIDANVSLPEFGDVKVRIDYVGPGSKPSGNGFAMDYIGLVLY